MLKPLEIKPGQIWLESRNLQGYELQQFQDAFDRYLPHSETLDPLGTSVGAGLNPIPETLESTQPRVSETSRNTRKHTGSRDPRVSNGGTSEVTPFPQQNWRHPATDSDLDDELFEEVI